MTPQSKTMSWVVGLVTILVATPACKQSDKAKVGAVADLRNTDNGPAGEATFEAVEGGVKIHFKAEHLPPGTHGFHIHENGECDPPSFESAGGHFNPTHAHHGLRNPEGHHLGDLPNLEVDVNGEAVVEIVAEGVTLDASGDRSLLAGNGTALVIHQGGDDQVSDPAGDAGPRIACGVIHRP